MIGSRGVSKQVLLVQREGLGRSAAFRIRGTRFTHPHDLAKSGLSFTHQAVSKTVYRGSRHVHMASQGDAVPESSKLLIVGPGVLGRYLGKIWLDRFGAGTVVGETKTTENHEKLKALGISPRRTETAPMDTYPYVAFCAPPSGSEDYPGDLKRALQHWDGTGNFMFTSSAGVYAVNDGSACEESSPVFPVGANPKTDALLLAEQEVLQAGGCVMRLVGLYHRHRGPHTFFLKQGEVARWGGYRVNMIHYEDAAGICAAGLMGQGSPNGIYRSQVFVGCDDRPVTFEEMMQAIEQSGVLPGKTTFTEKDGGSNLGKVMSNEQTRRTLDWTPKYSSIVSFFESGAEDWYLTHE